MFFPAFREAVLRLGVPLWSLLAVLSTGLALEGNASAIPGPTKVRVVSTYGQLPLSFEANHGQIDPKVKFLSRRSSYTLLLAPTEAVLVLAGPQQKYEPADGGPLSGSASLARLLAAETIVKMKLVGANAAPQIEGIEKLPGKSNYFIGSDPKKWRIDVPTYAKVKCQNVYPGIDLVYYGNQSQMEYDFIVAAGADPKSITLDFQGADQLRIDADGDLLLHVVVGQIRLRKPLAYQEVDGFRRRVPCSYVLTGENQVGFQSGHYDRSKPLLIDPVIAYSTYLGGRGSDVGHAIAVDSSGSAYVAGLVNSPNFPTANPVQPTPGSHLDLFVAKIDATGSALVYSTYLGGTSWDEGFGIAVDSSGNAYVTGTTDSPDFPTANAAQADTGGGDCWGMPCPDAFVSKLDATGAMAYSTYLGGSGADWGLQIAIDSLGNAYATGSTGSENFPTVDAFQATYGGDEDAFVTKFSSAGVLVYSTYLGGSDWENDFKRNLGGGVTVDQQGNAYVTGSTWSRDFPTVNAIQPTPRSGPDVFVAKLSPTGSGLLYSTYLGGSDYETGNAIAVDSEGNAYVTGETSSADFPLRNPAQGAFGGGQCFGGPCPDVFVAKLESTGSELVYSTFLGGQAEDEAFAIAVDAIGNAYITGLVKSENFPAVDAFQATYGGETDAFVAKFTSAGVLAYSTYLGGIAYDQGHGIAVDREGSAYVTGSTESLSFPITNPLQGANGGLADAFIAKITNAPMITSVSPPSSHPGAEITIGGIGFSTGSVEVFFNGASGLDVKIVNDTTILVTVPDLPPGPVEITVTTDGGSATLPAGPGGFSVTEPTESSVFFPQFADGAAGIIQFQSTLILANTGSDTSVRVELYRTPDGASMSLKLGDLGTASVFEFELGEGESISLATPGTGQPQVGYARVFAGANVGGVVVFRRTDLTTGASLYEAGVPASTELTEFCLFVDSLGMRDTGFAMVYPPADEETLEEASNANVTIHLYDKQYNFIAKETLKPLAPGSHLARYIHELFDDPQVKAQAREMQGILRVESDQPLVAVTVRQNDAPAREFPEEVPILTTFPVIPGAPGDYHPMATVLSSFFFPQFADGAAGTLQFQSTLILANTGSDSMVRVELYSTPEGEPMTLTLGELGTDSVFEFELKEGQSTSLSTPGTGEPQVGYARIVAGEGVGGVVVFRRTDLTTGASLYEAGVPASTELKKFCLFVDSLGVRDTGFALVYPPEEGGSSPVQKPDASVTLRLYDTQYSLIAERTLELLASGSHMARFVHEMFDDPVVKVRAQEMEGILVIESDQPLVGVTVRQNDDPAKEFPQEVPILTTFPVMPGAPRN